MFFAFFSSFCIFQLASSIDLSYFSSGYSQSGDGTYYGGNEQSGNCGLYPLPPFVDASIARVAMNQVDYVGSDQSDGCGVCLEINGTGVGLGGNPIGGPFIAIVNDRCPECAKGDIDLGSTGDGRWKIQWKAINCPVGSYKIAYMFEGSNLYYIKMQVRNLKVPVKKVEFKNAGSTTWFTGERTQDNFFLCPSCTYPSVYPLTVRLTSINDQVLTDQVQRFGANNEVISGTNGIQFAGVTAAPPTPLSPIPVPPSAPVPPVSPEPLVPQAPVPVEPPTNESESGTNTGAIVGGVIGGVVGTLIIAALVYYIFFVHKKDESV